LLAAKTLMATLACNKDCRHEMRQLESREEDNRAHEKDTRGGARRIKRSINKSAEAIEIKVWNLTIRWIIIFLIFSIYSSRGT